MHTHAHVLVPACFSTISTMLWHSDLCIHRYLLRGCSSHRLQPIRLLTSTLMPWLALTSLCVDEGTIQLVGYVRATSPTTSPPSGWGVCMCSICAVFSSTPHLSRRRRHQLGRSRTLRNESPFALPPSCFCSDGLRHVHAVLKSAE